MTSALLIHVSRSRSLRIFQPKHDFPLIPAETKREIEYTVMSIEGTHVKTILSHEAQMTM